MDEKIIIKGKFTKANYFTIGSVVLALISLIISYATFKEWNYEDYWLYALNITRPPEGIAFFFYLAIAILFVGVFFVIQMNFCELCVTDKRVYGKTSFGKMVDLPLDKISSVGTCIPKGIAVATSSGAIKFWLLTNQKEIYHAVEDLLKKRQNDTSNRATDEMDKLQKLKDLLDSGIITQEEFEAKKKQLLNL